MKRAFMVIGGVLLLIVAIISAVHVWHYCIRPSIVGDFDLNDYSLELDKFPHDGIVGPINDANAAKEKGIEELKVVFGEEQINNEKPFTTYYDKATNTWLLVGSLPVRPFQFGGVAHIIINGSDGDVLAVWHTK